MAEPFIAEIRLFPYTFAPKGWAFCDGQLIPIRQNTALFSLIGTTYGGNGTTIFALPNCQAHVVVGAGQAPGMANYTLGDTGGVRDVTLTADQGAVHTHDLKCVNPFAGTGSTNAPGPSVAFARGSFNAYTGTASKSVRLNPQTIGPSSTPTGAATALPHSNVQPYLGLSYCIALDGIFPTRP